mgnify:CR=1 FL=1
MLRDILAGLACGLIMGSVFLGVLIYIFLTNRDLYDRLAKRLPQGISPTLVLLSLIIGLPPAWCIFGLIAGSLYNLALNTSPGAGLGSSSSTFTLAIIVLTVLLMLPAFYFVIRRKKPGWLLLLTILIFAGLFGWLLPLLAHWR